MGASRDAQPMAQSRTAPGKKVVHACICVAIEISDLTVHQCKAASACRSNLGLTVPAHRAGDSLGRGSAPCCSQGQDIVRRWGFGFGSSALDLAMALPQPSCSTLGQLLRSPPYLCPICYKMTGYIKGMVRR